jgi:acetylornithine deacetylase
LTTESAVLARIDESRAVEILRRLINVSSPTGNEARCAEELADILNGAGVPIEVQRFQGTRANVVGTLQGSGDGVSLMLCGHLDTSGTGDPALDRASLGTVGAADRPQAFVSDGVVYGLGAYNMKGGLAAAAEALIALHESGAALEGSVSLAAVAGESEKAPVAGAPHDYFGPAYEGNGEGALWFLTHAERPDAVVICEPSDCQVANAGPGHVFVKVSVSGKPLYQGARGRELDDPSSVDVGARIVQAITSWERIYRERYRLWTGLATIYPNVTVGAIEGGWNFMPAIRPGVCNIYVDVRVPPHVDERVVIEELRAVVQAAAAPAATTLHVYANATPGTLTPVDHPLVTQAIAAREAELGPQSLRDVALNNSDDGKSFALFDIPYVMCGPGSTVRAVGGKRFGKEWVEIAQVVAAARIYARLAVSLTAVSHARSRSWPSVRVARSLPPPGELTDRARPPIPGPATARDGSIPGER